MSKDGGPIERGRKIPTPPNYSEVKTEIDGNRYTIVYDQKGLQKASPSASNPNSTWYAFDIKAGEKWIGEYHIHPSGARFFSGNLRVSMDGSRYLAMIGQAKEWQWLCDQVKSQVKPANSI